MSVTSGAYEVLCDKVELLMDRIIILEDLLIETRNDKKLNDWVIRRDEALKDVIR